MNSITVAGQLGRDAELRTLPTGDQVLSFSVADSQGREKPTIWWNCGLFGKRTGLVDYLKKGQAVTVTGKVTEREYKDKDGTPRKATEIRVNDIALQGGKREEALRPSQDAGKASQLPKQGSGFDDFEDAPF